jgi:hypothetical protein
MNEEEFNSFVKAQAMDPKGDIKIELGKKYRTRDGREARIYAVGLNGDDMVHGAVKSSETDRWTISSWYNSGAWGCKRESELDLIEVKPRIKRTVWLNVYPEQLATRHVHHSRSDADRSNTLRRIACVKVEIDCEEGEGLT